MTQADLLAGLEASGYPVAYHHFKSAQEPPYLVYFYVGSEDLKADDANYSPIGNYAIEFYTELKDPAGEAAIEAELATLGLTWKKSETYISEEQMYFVLYEVQVAITEDAVS